jgi:anaerobic magnesium-protoporphyrin IX monomethyl ester cyclase
MKIALISLYGVENIGIRSIASVLKQNGFKTRLFFLKKWNNNNIHPPTEREISLVLEALRAFAPGLIGLGFGSPYYRIAVNLTRRIRMELDVPIVWGGIHPTVCPEDCIDFADAVCVGEGEYPVLEMAQALKRGENYEKTENLWIRSRDTIIRNALRPLIRDLDELPYPEYGPSDKCFIEHNRCIEGEPLIYLRELRVCASRGCPFDCSYCYNSTLRRIYEGKGQYFRQYSADYIIGFIEYCSERLKVLRIKFDDDTFACNREWVREFCEMYKQRVKIPFEILLHPRLIDEDLIKDLKSAGMIKMQMGLESASVTQNEQVYNRLTLNEKIVSFSRTNARLRVRVSYDIIMDNPLASFDDKKKLLELLLAIKRPFDIFLYSLTFFPKTKIALDFLRRGLIRDDDIEGRATKSFHQFRLSFDYHRSIEDRFFVSLISLTSKDFIPRWFIRLLYKSSLVRRYPQPVELFSQVANLIKILSIGWMMFLNGELTAMKLKEYASPQKLMVQ